MDFIARALEDLAHNRWANLNSVGSRILGAAPDFDPRTYGCSNPSMLDEKVGRVRKEPDRGVRIRRKVVKGTTAGLSVAGEAG